MLSFVPSNQLSVIVVILVFKSECWVHSRSTPVFSSILFFIDFFGGGGGREGGGGGRDGGGGGATASE